MKRSSEPDFVGLANQRLVSTLTKNLANMEHFSKRDAVSSYFTFLTLSGKVHYSVIFSEELEAVFKDIFPSEEGDSGLNK